ncbi:MAG: hypothetical protein CL840_11735 [Crocinitomicaceae bacterium]|nr:hypothetical protein [Crocinitomicaceae bacterium]|tara:strand:+ start:2650 stop:3417 length:768 start_codon:yes stop_codon:yes gene_type:complete
MDENSKQVVFMGGKQVGYTCLKYLLENTHSLSIDVVGVFESITKTSSDEFSIGALCQEYEIPIFNNCDDLLTFNNLDFIISVQYGEILKKRHIDQAKEMAINAHMAPLPEYRGCNQFSFAIVDGAKEFGTSIHRLETSIDGGDLIAERRFKIPKDCFVQQLHKITVNETVALFKEEIGDIIKGNVTLIPQSELAKKRNSGFHLRNEIDHLKRIDNQWAAEKKKRYFRATYFPPFSPPVEVHSGKALDMDWYNSIS